MTLLFLVAVVLVLAGSVLVLAALRLPGRAAWLLGLYLLSYANIVLVGEITNSVNQLNEAWLWIALHLVGLVCAWLIWHRAGKPPVWSVFQGKHCEISFKRQPELWLLVIGVVIGYLFLLLLIWVTPPNNNDSLATHMARIGFWYQRGSFLPWDTDRVWQITYPVNAQLQIFWTVLFLGSDRIVESVQWTGALAALVAVYGLANLMGASRRQALFASLVMATFPEIVLEATTTQNDLVAGTLFASMLYLFYLGLYHKHPGALVLSGMALGLGLGTKQTLFFLLPGMALLFALALIYYRREVIRWLVIWGASALVFSLLLGAYMYVVNLATFGHPMGPESAVKGQTGGQTIGALKDNLVYNTFRLAYQAIDPTGLPDPLTGYGFKAKALVARTLIHVIGFPVESDIAVNPGHKFILKERYVLQEDAAWYGPLFSFLVLPAALYQAWVGLRKKDLLRVGIFIHGITFWLLDAGLRPGWDPFQGRYFIPVVMIAAATAAFVFRQGRTGVVFCWLATILALVILHQSITLNTGKPIIGEDTVWSMSRTELITQQSFYMRDVLSMVEKYVPGDATLGLITQNVGLEYPYFRENFSRRLVHIYPLERFEDVAWMNGQGIEYVIILMDEGAPVLAVPDGLEYVSSTGEWMLLTWKR